MVSLAPSPILRIAASFRAARAGLTMHWFVPVLALLAGDAAATVRSDKPNVVIILTDDQGYADVGFHEARADEVRTPHMDALARSGVVFTQAYTSASVCAPTRAGLMTGRYQQRYGIYTAHEGGSGVPFSEKLLPEYLAPAGYVCGAFGKWHLGEGEEYHPLRRGFDEFYGFLGRGRHDYFDLDQADHPMYRGLSTISDEGYLTDRITDEAVAFLRAHADEPFFAYVAYNAVHAPAQAPAADVREETGDEVRDVLLAMLGRLDDGVGRIVGALEELGVRDDTLVFFLTDNGGARNMRADNRPLRGYKGDFYEGGVRVPFAVSWPARIEGGTKRDAIVSSLDVLPTVLSAAGVETEAGRPLDGRDMLPVLSGAATTLHESLFWSSGGKTGRWAVRAGPWKLVGERAARRLFHLGRDLAEADDLATGEADKLAELERLHAAWLEDMAEPVSGGGKRWSP